jgi:cell division septation protein DedD
MAYALGPLGPDERQDRIFARRRGRRRLILLGAALLAVTSLGVAALYRSPLRLPTRGDVPLIRADDQPTRKRPDDPGGIQVPGQGTLVLDGAHADSKVEQLLPPPEAPLPRPLPPEPAEASSPPVPEPVVPLAAPQPPVVALEPPPKPTPPAKAPQPAAVAARQPPVVAVEPAPKPAASAKAPQPAAAAVPTSAMAIKGYRLQLGAVRSADAAKQEWDRLRRLNNDVLGPLSYAVQRVDLGERGIFYRIQAGPVADATAAERSCRELKRRGVGCILVKP